MARSVRLQLLADLVTRIPKASPVGLRKISLLVEHQAAPHFRLDFFVVLLRVLLRVLRRLVLASLDMIK